MDHKYHNQLSPEDFKLIIDFFTFLRDVRDQQLTLVDTLEPINDLNLSDDELERLVG